ncbi:hypothetical protein ACWTV9_14940 [Clostridioides difficile]
MKIYKKICFVFCISILVEIFIINFYNINLILNKNIEKNVSISKNQMEFINWKKLDDFFISEADPQIVISNIGTYIKYLDLDVSTENKISEVHLYYTENKNEYFNGEKMISVDSISNGRNRIKLDKSVDSIRVDLGESPGTKVKSIYVLVNKPGMNFSISRIVAMMIIYLGFVGLALLQKNPDYKI